MIYLSQLILNPRSRQVQSELANPYEMHRTLLKAFGDGPKDLEEARYLFRVEDVPNTSTSRVLVQSRTVPDWNPLTSTPGYLAEPAQCKTVSPAFKPGQRLVFRLRANPTVRHDGKRCPLLSEEAQLEWLERKAGEGGFVLCSVTAHHEPCVRFRKSEGNQTTLNAVRFEGLLLVRDPEQLVATLEAGIGSAKGFGFGLLSLARA